MLDLNFYQLIIKPLWPLWLSLLVIVLLKIFFDFLIPYYIRKYKNKVNFNKGAKWREDNDLIRWLRGMSPNEFEEYTAEMFHRLGYNW